MNEEQQSIILRSSTHFLLPFGIRLSYGTAGFRADASILEAAVFRIGILAALRSLKSQSIIGLMITASHNKISDNGVKIVDPSGGMMSQEWEPFADALVNAIDSQHLLQLIMEFGNKQRIPFGGPQSAQIILGRDTRPSGAVLLEAAKHGISSIIGAVIYDMGILTTPQLHWMVRARNKGMNVLEDDYFEALSNSFRVLMELIPKEVKLNEYDDNLVVDGANGVGGEKLEVLRKMLEGIVIDVRNFGKDGGVLNDEVGADYVQKEKVVPSGFCPNDLLGVRVASLDGDADRLVYFYVSSKGGRQINLVDGDKILSLFALFLKEQTEIIGDNVRLGAVQTAYANGASTNFLKQLGLDVVFTPTGVKYLHEKAAEFDIGIYFEANGHGTILFSEPFLCRLEARKSELPEEKRKAALRVLTISKLINQAAGDGLSGLLLVEIVLKHMGWSIQRWSELYQDLPSRHLKVAVADRSTIVTANAETVVVEPPGIQEAIDAQMAKYSGGRCFIRPSGTENIVRVYAEAMSQEDADELARSVSKIVEHRCLATSK